MPPLAIVPNVRAAPEERERTDVATATAAAAFGGELAR